MFHVPSPVEGSGTAMLQRGLPVVSLMQGPRGRKQWHPAAAAAATADLSDMCKDALVEGGESALWCLVDLAAL